MAPSSVAASRPVPQLSVRTLGLLELRQAGQRLPERRWNREKALELFCYFLTCPGQLTSKEAISEALWPASSAPQAERDFKVALNALNDALEPQRPPRQLAAYLRRQGSSYGLSDEAPLDLDYLQFEAKLLAASRLEDAEAAIRLYRQGLALYRGDYLPDQLAKDWTASTRERLQSLFLLGATQLARLLIQVGNRVEAAHWAERTLGLDPLWEEGYRLLMRCHLADGNRARAIGVYQALREQLAAQLGLEPLAKTQRLYREALGEAGEP